MPVNNQTLVYINKYRGIITALQPAIPLLFCEYTLDSSGLTPGDWLKAEVNVRKERVERLELELLATTFVEL
jgi:hypothetical protein